MATLTAAAAEAWTIARVDIPLKAKGEGGGAGGGTFEQYPLIPSISPSSSFRRLSSCSLVVVSLFGVKWWVVCCVGVESNHRQMKEAISEA